MLNTEHIVYTQSMATSAPLKNTVSTEEWLSATTFVKQRIQKQLLWITAFSYELLFH